MDKLKELLTEVFGVPENNIQDNKSLELIGLDSISIVEFQIEIERALRLMKETCSGQSGYPQHN